VMHEGWRNRGLGSGLFRELLVAAEARGVHRFTVSVVSDHQRVLDMITRACQVEHRAVTGGLTEVTFRRHP
jgi:L-amino acid N-acyltransferase YncA